MMYCNPASAITSNFAYDPAFSLAGKGVDDPRMNGPVSSPAKLFYRKTWLVGGWLLVAMVIWATLTPNPPGPDINHLDKLEHFSAYALLAAWFCELYRGSGRYFYMPLLMGMGVMLEFAQGYLGTRTLDVLDMLANTAGVLAAWAYYRWKRPVFMTRVEQYLSGRGTGI